MNGRSLKGKARAGGSRLIRYDLAKMAPLFQRSQKVRAKNLHPADAGPEGVGPEKDFHVAAELPNGR
jgi:hypothetical protein